jgi:predicted regulator of Ras-like GTPase activity (Roadblock/LC7/MglB family)
MAQTRFREFMEHLRNRVTGTKAIVLVGPGGVVDHLIARRPFDVDAFASEYATLLRIARRTSDDVGTGELLEHIVVAERSVIIARNILPDYYLIVVSTDGDQLGRARYELKCVARDLKRIL